MNRQISNGVSVVILTKNERADLPACLDALVWCDDVHVVDSGSIDGTVEFARSRGATCYHHEFESFGKQRNWSLDNCEFAHQWVLFVDADEVVTTPFRNEIKQALASNPADTVVGFYCCWKTMLNGTWLRFSDSFPRWQLRLVRRGAIRFVDFGHGQKEGDYMGEIKYIREPYLHYPFSKGWTYWFDRHNRYASLEAVQRLKAPFKFSELWARHSSRRVRAVKMIVSRLPGGPLFRFIHSYVFSLGFLDGRAGFHFAILMGIYEYMIKLKMSEITSRARALSSAADR